MADEAVAELRLLLAASNNVIDAHDSGDQALLDETLERLREISESLAPSN